MASYLNIKTDSVAKILLKHRLEVFICFYRNMIWFIWREFLRLFQHPDNFYSSFSMVDNPSAPPNDLSTMSPPATILMS